MFSGTHNDNNSEDKQSKATTTTSPVFAKVLIDNAIQELEW
jgi:hypothetical protein